MEFTYRVSGRRIPGRPPDPRAPDQSDRDPRESVGVARGSLRAVRLYQPPAVNKGAQRGQGLGPHHPPRSRIALTSAAVRARGPLHLLPTEDQCGRCLTVRMRYLAADPRSAVAREEWKAKPSSRTISATPQLRVVDVLVESSPIDEDRRLAVVLPANRVLARPRLSSDARVPDWTPRSNRSNVEDSALTYRLGRRHSIRVRNSIRDTLHAVAERTRERAASRADGSATARSIAVSASGSTSRLSGNADVGLSA